MVCGRTLSSSLSTRSIHDVLLWLHFLLGYNALVTFDTLLFVKWYTRPRMRRTEVLSVDLDKFAGLKLFREINKLLNGRIS